MQIYLGEKVVKRVLFKAVLFFDCCFLRLLASPDTDNTLLLMREKMNNFLISETKYDDQASSQNATVYIYARDVFW